jgi:hypothetical protein
VIPTRDRAEELDRQLRWLYDELVELDVTWEVRVHDNCSSDHTPQVTSRWQAIFGAEALSVVRNERDVGGMPNLALALAGARGHWVWSMGDDDHVRDGACASLVDTLQAQSDLALLYLSYRGVDAATGRVVAEHFLDPVVTGRFEDGRRAFAHHALRGIGSVIFLTSTVYRTEIVHAALGAWRDDVDNWALVAYWTGYAAARGPIYITPEQWIDCTMGVSYWQREAGAWVKAVHHDIPKVSGGLAMEGYPAEFCRRLGPRVRWLRLPLHLLVAIRHCPACLRSWPRRRGIRQGSDRLPRQLTEVLSTPGPARWERAAAGWGASSGDAPHG